MSIVYRSGEGEFIVEEGGKYCKYNLSEVDWDMSKLTQEIEITPHNTIQRKQQLLDSAMDYTEALSGMCDHNQIVEKKSLLIKHAKELKESILQDKVDHAFKVAADNMFTFVGETASDIALDMKLRCTTLNGENLDILVRAVQKRMDVA